MSVLQQIMCYSGKEPPVLIQHILVLLYEIHHHNKKKYVELTKLFLQCTSIGIYIP